MTQIDLAQLGYECMQIIKRMSPIKTGNLRYNAIKFEMPSPNTFKIFVDESVAPYMPYTNEVWEHKLIKMGNFVPGEVVERMRTWDNPNEGWFDRAVRTAIL
ncbi:MAG: hypothetical protein K2L51_04720, partial [Clostridiales bacterium]|nr:hypothetical protein [Clostridiales bacterium]